ncbi:unnamed protein product [Enterobius vermicularis]|uniref:TIL domain-containing protein n=1 Tax=Enterobius vermicularis TaxID=51028 RepID=A0A0N4V496_ENTVE|nr:unnamed protein product [Enterobius vermicularis]
MQCVPVCQPICQPSCTTSFNNLQSQFGEATVPCDSQVCICPSGYVKCAEQTCCLRYRYTSRKAKRGSR